MELQESMIEFQECCLSLSNNYNNNNNNNNNSSTSSTPTCSYDLNSESELNSDLLSILSCLDDVRHATNITTGNTTVTTDSDTTATATTLTLRSLLDNKIDTETFSNLLTNLISNRRSSDINIDNDYDGANVDADNDTNTDTDTTNTNTDVEVDIIDNAWWTITPVAINAARVYLEISRIKGAWGSGWMHVGILCNIEALVRRFGQEARGKSLSSIQEQGQGQQHAEEEVEECNDNVMMGGLHLSNSISHVLKSNDYWSWSKDARDALMDTAVLALGICSSLYSIHEHNTCTITSTTNTKASPQDSSSHFVNGGNARRKRSSQQATTIDQVQYCIHIVRNISIVMQQCIVQKVKTVAEAYVKNMQEQGGSSNTKRTDKSQSFHNDDDDEDAILFSHMNATASVSATATPTSVSEDAKKMTITFLRAIYPILEHQLDLPNGTKGKSMAYSHACKLVIGILSSVAKIVNSVERQVEELQLNADAVREVCDMTTPSKGRAAVNTNGNGNTLTPIGNAARRTPRSLRKSIDGIVVVPPSLKKHVMTPRFKRRQSLTDGTRGHENQNPNHTNNNVHTTAYGMKGNRQKESDISSIMNTFVGFMQKMSTSKGMEKADVRGRIADFLKACLVELPSLQKGVFLRFIMKLCRSKMSAHRIFGVEVIGVCFLIPDLWTGEHGISSQSAFTDADASTSMNTNMMNASAGKPRRSGGGESEFPPPLSEFASPDVACLAFQEGNIANELLSTLHGRLNDKAPAVRTRAASAIHTAIASAKDITNPQVKSRLDECILNFRVPLITSLRFRASMDEKATVRRAAIIALVEIILFNNGTSEHDDIAVLSQMCNASSVAVRKSALDAIVSLHLQEQESEDINHESLLVLESSWADVVLPLVYDTENACAVKVVESFLDLVINPIIDYEGGNDTDTMADDNDNATSTVKYQSAWRMLSRINTASSSAGSSKGGKNALVVVLQKSFEVMESSDQRNICRALFKELYANVVEELHSTFSQETQGILSDRMIGSWCLLEGITSLLSTNELDIKKEIKKSSIGTDFLVDCWESISDWCNTSNPRGRKNPRYIATARSCLRVISAFAPMMTQEAATRLSQSIIQSLKHCSLGLDVIGSSIAALVQITQSLNNNSAPSTQKACTDWINDALKDCETILNGFVTPNGSLSPYLDRALYTIGELLMVGFNPSEDANQAYVSALKGSGLPGKSTDNCIRGLRIKPTPAVILLVQALLLPTLPKEGDSRDETIIPNKLRAHAFVTFGKMCLRDEALARGSINIFARELRQEGESSDPAVKSNALLVLGDFCIRYTHHVDKFIPLMASCLQPTDDLTNPEDSDESIVRHHAILILSNLILQDYIKWKGVLFYRFLAATVDRDPSVANLAKLILCGPLLTKQPSLFFNNFVDALFILNGCTAHPMYTKRDKNKNKNDTHPLRAEGLDFFRIDNSIKREEIYSLLLDHMSDEEKIGATARLSKEVLSAAAEMKGELRSAANTNAQEARVGGAYSVLSDCFQILISPKMHIGRTGTSLPEDDGDVNISTSTSSDAIATTIASGPNVSQITSARGKLLSKISRKHLMDTVLPILCNLKTIFEKSHSPLLRNLMQYLVCIFGQFKKEVNETLASNQTLLKEIQYDTKQFEREEKGEKKQC